ncbi:MAG: hypothetical protein GY880_24790, partial [Planctomycetaceae bacterium]|nr:hypothetical protein [Planctomycetaceae bacterium]
MNRHFVGDSEFPYEFMMAKDPCSTCKSKPYCCEAQAICRAFDDYVSTGSFDEKDRGTPIYGAYQDLV